METFLTQLGVGGILAILLLREVFGFLKGYKGGKDNKGNKDSDVITRTEFESHKNVVQYRENCKQIVKRIDGQFETADERAKDRHGEIKILINSLSKK